MITTTPITPITPIMIQIPTTIPEMQLLA